VCERCPPGSVRRQFTNPSNLALGELSKDAAPPTQRRQFNWYAGEIRCASYNHYYAPNSNSMDCVVNAYDYGYTAMGWQAARSLHPRGVNMLLCDGSVKFMNRQVDRLLWQALATRAGREIVGDF
jgi:prepilin-type processing-associated H-X9-DG protein